MPHLCTKRNGKCFFSHTTRARTLNLSGRKQEPSRQTYYSDFVLRFLAGISKRTIIPNIYTAPKQHHHRLRPFDTAIKYAAAMYKKVVTVCATMDSTTRAPGLRSTYTAMQCKTIAHSVTTISRIRGRLKTYNALQKSTHSLIYLMPISSYVCCRTRIQS